MRIIIIGAGQVGCQIAKKLSSEYKEVIIIDKSAEVLERISQSIDVQTVHGSGSSPKILEMAGIKEADMLLAVTDSDEINLIACTFANILSPGLDKIARIRNPEYTSYQEVLAKGILNIDTVINPEEEVVRSIERLMGAPGALEITDFSEETVKLVGTWIREGNPLAGTKLYELRKKIGYDRFIIAAIVRNDRLIVPSGDNALKVGDLIYFVCEDSDLKKILKRLNNSSAAQHNVLIIGGGNIGFKLAQTLEKKNVHAKILDNSLERTKFLSENLNRTVVLQGDGTDQELLLQENIKKMDVVITLTGDEENNILCSLLAKRLGAKRTITRINKLAYIPLVQAIGIEHTVSPRLSAVNTIIRHVRKGLVISSVSIKEEAEVMEAIAKKNSGIVNKPLKNLTIPKGAIILCIIRADKVIIPTGDSVIQPEDRFIILCTRKNIPKVEKALTIKLENY